MPRNRRIGESEGGGTGLGGRLKRPRFCVFWLQKVLKLEPFMEL